MISSLDSTIYLLNNWSLEACCAIKNIDPLPDVGYSSNTYSLFFLAHEKAMIHICDQMVTKE